MHQYIQNTASPMAFTVCHGYSCASKAQVSLSPKQWESVINLFTPHSKTPEQERQNIAAAISLLESLSTQSAKLIPDRAKATGIRDHIHQMDCIDETINTDLYLQFIERAKVLKFHTHSSPLHRGFIINGVWPHNSAAIIQKSNQQIYAVDSFYRNSAEKVDIIPKEVWRQNWKPHEN